VIMSHRHKPQLIVRLKGGLGNQLFEYAAGRALALRNNVPLWLDTTSGFRDDPYGRRYELGNFKLQSEPTEESSPAEPGIRAHLFRKFVQRRELFRMQLFGQYFDPAIYNLRITRPIVLDAYCQSPRYFDEIVELLRRELEFDTTPPGIAESTVQQTTQGNSVCLHLRRLHGTPADRSLPQAVADFYGTSEIAYYRSAIRELAAAHGCLNVLIFSDDIGWAQQNSGAFDAAGCSVSVIEDEDPFRNFYLMRLCKHFIIANSTFSWWAAWLGKYSIKTVCVPRVWNHGERHHPLDLFPPAWKVIPTASTMHATPAALPRRQPRRTLG
jgi:glycosyl transferase family 11